MNILFCKNLWVVMGIFAVIMGGVCAVNHDAIGMGLNLVALALDIYCYEKSN